MADIAAPEPVRDGAANSDNEEKHGQNDEPEATEAAAVDGGAGGPVAEFEVPSVEELAEKSESAAPTEAPSAEGGLDMGQKVAWAFADQGSAATRSAEGGLGMGCDSKDESSGLPSAGAPPQIYAPGSAPPASSSCCGGTCGSPLSCISQGAPPLAGAATAVSASAPSSETVASAAEAEANVPPAKSKYKSGGLRTTVNTPVALVQEADMEEGPPDADQYMYYAQQYAQVAQQYAAYAQFCAQYADQVKMGDMTAEQQQALMAQQQQQMRQMQQPQQVAQQPRPQPASSSSSSGSQQVAPQPASSSGSQQVAPQPGGQQAAAQQKNTPIMVTPYRHNWLISGNHRSGGPDGAWWNGIKDDFRSAAAAITRTMGCRDSCTARF